MSDATDADYPDLYGRIWKYDPVLDTCTVYLEGGPDFADSPTLSAYPDKHLSNPDGLNLMRIQGVPFLVIQEDLNGTSGGRTPDGVSNRTCEVYLLDLRLDAPTVDDLIRITAVPQGAEVTGAMPTPDGKSLLLNVQHPYSGNPFPFNHSLTFAIHGFDQLNVSQVDPDDNPLQARELGFGFDGDLETTGAFTVSPDPTTRTIHFTGGAHDVAVYDADGQRVLERQGVTQVDVSTLAAGTYFVRNGVGETVRLVVQ